MRTLMMGSGRMLAYIRRVFQQAFELFPLPVVPVLIVTWTGALWANWCSSGLLPPLFFPLLWWRCFDWLLRILLHVRADQIAG